MDSCCYNYCNICCDSYYNNCYDSCYNSYCDSCHNLKSFQKSGFLDHKGISNFCNKVK